MSGFVNRVLTLLDGLTGRPWFGDAVTLALCAVVIGLSVVMAPSTETLSLFGVDIPVLCGFRMLTGTGCPGCGLTRSFVFLGHGHVVEAFRMNLLGPPLFLLAASQIPYRIYRIARIRKAG